MSMTHRQMSHAPHPSCAIFEHLSDCRLAKVDHACHLVQIHRHVAFEEVQPLHVLQCLSSAPIRSNDT